MRRTSPLSGVKRTCRFALQMSANNPKRTWQAIWNLLISLNAEDFKPLIQIILGGNFSLE
jgi:hypothetical protein